ncbi:MAG: accessory gene regulator ArgB-like protein [Acetivibrionales bacterium]
MRFIRVWSYKCAHYLTKQLNESYEKRGVYYFGFQVIIGSIVKIVSLVLITLILGTFISTFTALAFFVSLRIIAGGYHMDTYGKCMVMTLVLFVASGLTVQYTYALWPAAYIAALILATFAAALYVILRWVPSDTPNRPITKPEEKKKFRTLSLVHICLWIIAEFVLLYSKQNMIALAGCFGIIISIFIITPAGHKLFDMISGKVDQIKKTKTA